jgi:hypothetical protein
VWRTGEGACTFLWGDNLKRTSSNATCAREWKTNCYWLNVFRFLFILRRECQSLSKSISLEFLTILLNSIFNLYSLYYT